MGHPKSAIEVGVEVVAGLIAVGAQRERVIDNLRVAVEAAVVELDPDGRRNRTPTWFVELDPWVKLDSYDRMRKSYEDLMLVEEQAAEIVAALRTMLTPHVVRADRRPLTPRSAYDQLGRLAGRRADYATKLANAERRLRGRLRPETAAGLRRALRELRDEDRRGAVLRDRLGRLLTMADLVAS